MTSRLRLACLLLLTLAAAAAEAQPAGRDLGSAIQSLRDDLEALRRTVVKQGTDSRDVDAGLAELRWRLEALEKAAAGSAELTAKLDELAQSLEELREDAATKSELKKYERKPNEKEWKQRFVGQVEPRASFYDFRTDEIARTRAGLAMLVARPGTRPQALALAQALGAAADTLLLSDARLRPRMAVRLLWEASRFVDESDYVYLYAEPEFTAFVYDPDVDRFLLPRDFLRPRERLAVIFKRAAIGLSAGRLSVEAGFLQFTYGAGFFINPTDPWTPKDPLDPRKEVDGVPAARVNLGIVESEGLTLSAQTAYVARGVRNDLLGEHRDDLGLGGYLMLRADTSALSVTGIALWQQPDAAGRASSSFGGIISTAPFGLTLSLEGLATEGPEGGDRQPELIASLQGFTGKIFPNGLTYIVEYYLNGHGAADAAEARTELAAAVLEGNALLAVDRLVRPLGRKNYLNLYLEPSLTAKLRMNFAGLFGFDGGTGVLTRVGLDYDYYNLSVHAFAGATFGADESEWEHHLIQSFAELVFLANF